MRAARLLVALSILWGSAVFAQDQTGQLRGRVLDASGVEMPGTVVVLTNRSSGAVRQAVTDKEGNFEIANLPAGEHEFVIWHEKAGYLERKHKVTIAPGQTQEVKLEFGGDKLLASQGPGEMKTINISALSR